jgi:thiol-disulfide isomerase/thioredoxin
LTESTAILKKALTDTKEKTLSQTRNKQHDSKRPEVSVATAKRYTRKRRLLWAGVTAAVIGSLVILTLTRPTPEGAAFADGRASTGEPAPNVEMVDFDGEQVTFTEYLGTPIVLNFWASWCPFCIAEMPGFERVNQDAAGRVAFIGVNLQDDPGLATQLAGETGVTYRLARDPQGVVYAAFGGIGMPTTVFIDADGLVSEVITGQMSEDQLRSKIEEHFSVGTSQEL